MHFHGIQAPMATTFFSANLFLLPLNFLIWGVIQEFVLENHQVNYYPTFNSENKLLRITLQDLGYQSYLIMQRRRNR